MKKTALFAAASLLAWIAAPAQAAYMPVGPQTEVLKTTVTTGGWTLCWQGNYASTYNLATVLAGCSGGTNLMMAASASTSATTFTVLAQAAFADVTFNTGTGSNSTHTANGTAWYFNNSYSWGFAAAGQSVSRNSCDTASADGARRLCWHTSGGNIASGYRAGTNFLNGNSTWQRYLYVNTGTAVPEPGALALLGLGVLGLAGARRRRA